MIDFPASPTIGQQFTAAGVTWTWDGVKWLPSGLSPTLVAGINDNRIINGDMRIDQRNGGASGTVNGQYTIDRWIYSSNQASKGTWGQNLNAITGPPGFPYYLGFQSTTAYVSTANASIVWLQVIEADMISDFAWSTANAQPVTLSFWVHSSLTGSFGGSLRDKAATRSYPFTYSIPVANTWTKIAVTIPGDTAGAWVMSGNLGSLFVALDLGSGTNYQGTVNTWASALYQTPPGMTSTVAVNGAHFYLTGVKLEIGSVATPYNRQSLAKSIADCQRYYQFLGALISGYNTAGNAIYISFFNAVTMRTTPTVVLTPGTYSNCSGVGTGAIGPGGFFAYAIVTATGMANVYANAALSAEL